ncbi:hypothetical protein FDG2_2215 [Candidatus Protofrankia californiensis]|uniref:Uncharacterized protein n=1 Tax=Candidatus Protofrankia californiensis TaxID=1839754 RepID=A0A1C3NX46_9ACTN|nr:hypothetical protein FDG2_2215 [Candidatus Protofrankia californiensis]
MCVAVMSGWRAKGGIVPAGGCRRCTCEAALIRGWTVVLMGRCLGSEADGDATDCEVIVTMFGPDVAVDFRRCPHGRSRSEWVRTAALTVRTGQAHVRPPAAVTYGRKTLTFCQCPAGASLSAEYSSDLASQILTAWRCRIETSAGCRTARSASRSAGDHNCLRRCRRSLGVTLGLRSRQHRHPRLQRGAPAPGVTAPAHVRAEQACRRRGDRCR